MRYLIGVDIGTSGTKTVLFDADGAVVASASREYPLYQPQNGWAEQKPEDWWDATLATLTEVVAQSGVQASDIAGIGLAGQMHGLVMLDGDGEVIRPSIIWCDGRTTRECAEITEIIGAERLIAITANPALAGFTAGKIRWVKRHEPENYARCRHILLPKDYIRYKLTGVFATEVSDASGMNLLDVPNRCWSDEVIGALGFERDWFADMYESADVTGGVTKAVADRTGLKEGTIVVGGAGDNAAAAIGTGVVEAGKAFTTIGTSGVIFAHMDTVSIDPKGRVHTFCSAVPGAWTVMSCTLAAGLSLKWFRDNFAASEMATAIGMGVDPYVLMNEQIDRVPIGANKLVYLPYLMGDRSPILNENARGVFFGLSAMHTRFDLMRAVMEGVTFSLRDCLDVLIEMGIAPERMMACGGGAASPVWRRMMADLFGCDVVTVGSKEGPALGVALLAGVGAGIYANVQEACRKTIFENTSVSPDRDRSAQYEPLYRIYRGLYPALEPSFAALSTL